jgi:hypothetical protein
MKPQNEEQKLTEGQTKAKKPRFKIDKLEQRIAPFHHNKGICFEMNPHGKLIGHCK